MMKHSTERTLIAIILDIATSRKQSYCFTKVMSREKSRSL